MKKVWIGSAASLAVALSLTTTLAVAANNTPIYMLPSHSEVSLKVLATANVVVKESATARVAALPIHTFFILLLN